MFNTKSITDLSGRKIGQLIVEHPSHFEQLNKRGNWTLFWRCKCDCGTSKLVSSANLQSRHTLSCGCASRLATSLRNFKHGLHGHALYKVWKGMRQRCENKNNPAFKNYGGRGIFVDRTWEDFAQFVRDVGASYKPGLTLERIDNNGPYAAWNCKWATRLEQSNNRRVTRFVEHQGKRFTISQLATLYGLSIHMLRQRVFRYNWTLERALKP